MGLMGCDAGPILSIMRGKQKLKNETDLIPETYPELSPS